MNPERELLRLAAKAAGITLLIDPHGVPRDCTEMDPAMNIFAGKPWNSITDDGDALRLAVKLRMDVEPWIHGDSAFSRVLCQEVLIDEPHYEEDPYAATRRAITRAAAEIGKAMK